MARPPSSFYSQDGRRPDNLGYKPFEYWKGPKPVAWPSARKPNSTHGRKHSGPGPSARTSAGAVSSLGQLEPMQPSQLYSAQQFVASLQAARLAETKRVGQSRAPGDVKPGGNGPWDPDDKGRLGAAAAHGSKGWAEPTATAGVQVSSSNDLGRSHSTRSSPPDYEDLPPLDMKGPGSLLPQGHYGDDGGDSWWDFRTWRRRTWAIIAAVIAAIIIAVVVVVTMLQKKNAYPNYTRLVYRDTQRLGSPSARAGVSIARHLAG